MTKIPTNKPTTTNRADKLIADNTQPIFNNDEVCNIPTNQCRQQRQNYNPLKGFTQRVEQGMAKPVGRPIKAQHNNKLLTETDFLPEINPAS